jgi:translation initiation factor 3 subunit I
MRPILLKGHERSITYVAYNYDGDLLFTSSKDNVPTVWNAENGERIGTYNGHQGTVWDMDCNKFSTRVLTASADTTVKLWGCLTGEEIVSYTHRGPVRGVAFADGGNMFASIADPFMENDATISIYDIPEDQPVDSYSQTPRLEIPIPKSGGIKATAVVFLNLNEALFVTFDDGSIRLYDPLNGDELEAKYLHSKKVNRVAFNREKTLFLTSSADCTAKLHDAVSLEHLKTYTTDRPVNAAVIHPTREHILLGGGQEAMSVTTTGSRSGKFETRLFHLVYEEEFGIIKGHFGPINALAINPDGRSYASGAEDGYIRLHFFDREYLEMKDPVPKADPEEEKAN